MIITLTQLRLRSANRPDGYIEDVIKHATVSGEYLEISEESLRLLRDKYRGTSERDIPECSCCGKIRPDHE